MFGLHSLATLGPGDRAEDDDGLWERLSKQHFGIKVYIFLLVGNVLYSGFFGVGFSIFEKVLFF